MQHYRKGIILSGICASALIAASSQGEDPGFYIKADAGGNLTGSTRVKEFFGPVDTGTRVHFDPGVRFGFAGGYRFCDYFSLEGETGLIGNNINSITGATIDGNATFANVPFLANVRIEPHHFGRFSTYIGGGLGGSASIISAEHQIDLGGTTMHGDQGTVVFAYQAFAGIKYAFAPNMDVGVEYHYFATTGPTWKADNTFGTATDELRFAGVTSHTISAAFTLHF